MNKRKDAKKANYCMIREMRASDWDDMVQIYKQSLEKGDVTFLIQQFFGK